MHEDTKVPRGATFAPYREGAGGARRLRRGAVRGTAFLLGAFALLGGCQTARVEQPVAATLGGNDPEQQLEFWHSLAAVPVTSNDDAFHGLLLYLDGADPAADYAGRVAALKDRGLLAAKFDEPADAAVTRGTMAVALVKALGVRGGWEMSVFGVGPRLAVRELQFADVYPASSPNQTFSGTEFLGIMGKVEDYQRVGADQDEPLKTLDVGEQQPQPEAVGEPPPATTPEAPGE